MIKRLSLEECQKVARFAFEKAKAIGPKPIAVAFTDQGANLIYLALMDGVHPRCGTSATAKAFTSGRLGKTTAAILQSCIDNHYELASFCCPGITSTQGGAPINDVDGEHIGGIGLSGLPAVTDQELAAECLAYFLELRGVKK